MGYPSVVLRQCSQCAARPTPTPYRQTPSPLRLPPAPTLAQQTEQTLMGLGPWMTLDFPAVWGHGPPLRPRLSPPHQQMKNKPETHTAPQRCAPPPATESPLRQVPARRKLKGPRGVARKHTAPPQGRRAAVENIGPGGSFPTRGAARRPRPRPSRACPGMRMFPPPLPWIPLRLTTQTPTPTTQHARCRTAKQMPECDAADWCGLGFRPSHGRRVPHYTAQRHRRRRGNPPNKGSDEARPHSKSQAAARLRSGVAVFSAVVWDDV